MRVLIADDAADVRFLHGELVESFGYDTEFATNGKEALDLLLGPDPPHIALLDWMMPGVDGVEICKQVRGSSGSGYVYLILVTSRSGRDDIVRGLDAGADDFIVKPVDPGELRSRLKVGARVLEYEHRLQQYGDEMARLARERAIFQQVFQASVQPVCITDPKGVYLYANPAYLEFTGLPAEKLAGKTPNILNPGRRVYADAGISEKEYNRLFTDLWTRIQDPKEGYWTGTVLDRVRDGSLRWVNLIVSAIRDAGGRLVGFVGMPVDITQRVEEERSIRMACYRAIVDLAEARDHETGAHLKRMGEYSRLLAEQLGMPKKYVEDIALFAPFHDIGKVGVPDRILLAPRKLTKEEFEIIKTHPTIGYEILKNATTLEMAAQIAYTHHERHDGKGYPRGIAGEAIPLSGRIVALADVYDALRSRRPYKEPWSHSAAVDLIRSESGSHFDPQVVEAFLALEGAFADVWERWRDAPGDENRTGEGGEGSLSA